MVEFAGGIKAVLPGDWHFNSYFEHGRNENDLADRELSAYRPVVPGHGRGRGSGHRARSPAGSIWYQPGYGCVPIDLLGAGRATPQAIAYVTAGTKTAYLTNTQDAFEATVDGKLFKDFWKPGPDRGRVRCRLSPQHAAAERRRSDQPDEQSQLRGRAEEQSGTRASRVFRGAFAGVNSGVQFSIQANFQGVIDVKEAFGEVQVPLLKDQPFAERPECERGRPLGDLHRQRQHLVVQVWAGLADARLAAIPGNLLARRPRGRHVGAVQRGRRRRHGDGSRS